MSRVGLKPKISVFEGPKAVLAFHEAATVIGDYIDI
jgi:hypothetical protein